MNRLFFTLMLLCSLGVFVACDDKVPPLENERQVVPPDVANAAITTYFPDSGGIATKMILYGQNFGTDLDQIKVYMVKVRKPEEQKQAAVIGCDGEAIYAIMPRQADTCFIKVVVGKEGNQREFMYEDTFKYQFKKNVTTVYGIQKSNDEEPVDGDISKATFRRPWNIACDAEGAVYVIDEGRGNDKNGGIRLCFNNEVSTLARNTSGIMQSPTVLAFTLDCDTLLMLNNLWDDNNMNTRSAVGFFLRNDGFSIVQHYVEDPQSSHHGRCSGLAVNPVSGDVFFYSRVMNYVYRFDKASAVNMQLQQLSGISDAEVRLTFNNAGTILYMIMENKHCIYKADYNLQTKTLGKPALFVGQLDKSGYQDGRGAGALFNGPGQGTVDQDDFLFVPEYNNHIIRRISPDGEVTLWAGTPNESGYKDGDPLEAQFKNPQCVTFNPADYGLYVADRYNHVIRRVMIE